MRKRQPALVVPSARHLPARVLPPLHPAPMWVTCAEHPQVSFKRGGFCTACYADETQSRIRRMDDGFEEVLGTAVLRLKEILELPVTAPSETLTLEQLKVTLGPILRAVEMVDKRFRRPDQLDVRTTNRSVSLVGTPIDFAKASVRGEIVP